MAIAVWRERHLRQRYGMSLEDYDRMYSLQDGRCAICGRSLDLLCVDHNHQTGEVRGLLCKVCNQWLGLVDDDPKKAIKAARYMGTKLLELLIFGAVLGEGELIWRLLNRRKKRRRSRSH